MPNSENNRGDSAARLDALRAEIDAVDDALHGLLMRRAALTEHMGALKRKGGSAGGEGAENPVRPAREAAILRRLAARHTGPLAFEVVVQVWRDLIAANLRRQCALELAVVETGDQRLWDAARAAFGALTPAVSYFRVQDAIRAAAKAPGTLAVLPAPGGAAPELQMWPELLTGEGAPRILNGLPSLVRDDWPEAFIVGRAPREPSGEDISYVLLTSRAPCSEQPLRQAGLQARLLAEWPAMTALGLYCSFAAVQGFLQPADAALERLAGLQRGEGGRAALIGSAPAPIRLPDG